MRNVFTVVSSVASAALLLSGAAMAGFPTGVTPNTWSVDAAGTISGAGTGCATQVVGAGFLQCQVVIEGKTYIQTIIAEGYSSTNTTPSSLSFRSQDFVQIGAGSSQGLASSMGIKDSTTNPGTTFETTANILTGWATSNAGTTTPNKSEADLTLNLNTPGAASANEGFASSFNVTAVTDAANNNLITALGVGQTVGLGGAAGDKQRFELRNVPSSQQVVWAAQSVTGTDNFSVTRSTNLSTSAVIGSSTNLGSTAVDAAIWTTTFGAVPTF